MSGHPSAVSAPPAAPWHHGEPAEPGPSAGAQRWLLTDTLSLGSLPTAVPCARLHARHILREWNLAQITDDAELILSELVTNALQASWRLPSRPPIGLRLRASPGHLMIEVWDAQPAPPSPQPHAIDAEGGRGLEIVTLLADRWGYYHPTGGGKTVWATLTTSPHPGAGDSPNQSPSSRGTGRPASSAAGPDHRGNGATAGPARR